MSFSNIIDITSFATSEFEYDDFISYIKTNLENIEFQPNEWELTFKNCNLVLNDDIMVLATDGRIKLDQKIHPLLFDTVKINVPLDDFNLNNCTVLGNFFINERARIKFSIVEQFKNATFKTSQEIPFAAKYKSDLINFIKMFSKKAPIGKFQYVDWKYYNELDLKIGTIRFSEVENKVNSKKCEYEFQQPPTKDEIISAYNHIQENYIYKI